ncbi:NADPH oxidase [Clavulina sp. PMI_390]|nr:NADPH oxidase [Clavulina sp. PMI_390]
MAQESWFRREFLSWRRLLFNILFHGSHCALFAYGWWSQLSNEKLAGLNTLEYSVWASRGAGLALAYDGGLIMLPMLRNILRVLRPALSWVISMDDNIWFHRQVAYSMAMWTVVHVTAHYVNFIKVERTQLRAELAVQIHYNQAGGITGHFMLTVMLLMYSTASAKIRKQCFEAFWYTHHLAFFFMLALFSHATGCFVRDSPNPDFKKSFPFYSTEHCLGYESWRFIIWPFVLYFGERMWREIRARRYTRLDKVLVHPSGAIELRMIKPGFRFTPGQWVFIQVPSVSGLQWHPFSISSAPEDPYVSVTIRSAGDWTEAVSAEFGAGPAVVEALANATKFYEVVSGSQSQLSLSANPNQPQLGAGLPVVRMDGPYGAPSQDVFHSDLAILVGAGIGVTPFASILKHIWYRQRAGTLGRLRHVEFIWVCRDPKSFAWFGSVLREIEDAQVDPNFLRISIYITEKLSVDQLYNLAINDANVTGAGYDPMTRLRSRTFYGRPDFRSIYGKVRDAVEEGALIGGREMRTRINIGTYFCGPAALSKIVKQHALGSSTPSARFTFAKEHF